MVYRTLLGKGYTLTTNLFRFQFFLLYVDLIIEFYFFVIDRIKTNVNRGPTFWFVNANEYITVSYYDEEHSYDVGGSNMLVYPLVMRKL